MENKGNNFSSRNFVKGRKPIGFETDSIMKLGKLPPQSIPLEEAVLGALLLEKKAFEDIVDIIKVETFYKDSHKLIYQSMLDLSAKASPIDLLTVRTQLEKNGTLETVGGAIALVRLTTEISTSTNVVYHAHELIERSIKRQMIGVASDVDKSAYEDTTDAFDILDATQQELFKITEENIRKKTSDMSSVYRNTLKELEERIKNRKNNAGITGVASGFTALDAITSGWQRSDLIILAARPGMGKTAFVLSALTNAAVRHNKCMAIFSLEMSGEQLLTRMMSSEAQIESQKLRSGEINDNEWQQLIHGTTQLSASKIFIDDTPAITMLELRAKARRLKVQHNLDMIIIDYLQLMSGDSGSGGGNREQEIAGISRGLKQLAKELDIPVMALSQLSRAVETRGGDKRPMLSDLRESGSIEQDADMVIFLYRPEYYGITEDEQGITNEGIAEVMISKNRHGSIETVKLRFVGRYTKFQDLNEINEIALGHDNLNTNYNRGIMADDLSEHGFSTFQSKGNNMNPIDNDLKNNKSVDFDDEPPF